MSHNMDILVVDDELVMRESLAAWLKEDGHDVRVAASGEEALAAAARRPYDVFFLDLKMPPGMSGIETMVTLRERHEGATYIIITAYATVDTAVLAMKEGADEYLVKPCNPEEITMLLDRVARVRALQRENSYLRRRLEEKVVFQDIISKNARMRQVFDTIREIASVRSTVLVLGESGTGKELVARAIHQAGKRASEPFVTVSCAALPETLLESELFGHERGAFTGAVSRKIGRFEAADGGTILLDEIGDVSPKLQADLLRVLQEKTICRVGSAEEIEVDVRVIAATNRDLREEVRSGRFREDLFYRLNVVTLALPPLRERRDDIPLLARHFVERLGIDMGRTERRLCESALRVLVARDWPGNVRELENAIERAMVTCRDELLDAACFDFLQEEPDASLAWKAPDNMTLRHLEQHAIESVLQRTGGKVTQAAEILGIDRTTLYEKIKKYSIKR